MTSATLSVPLAGFSTEARGGWRGDFGCGYSFWGPNTCVAGSPHEIKGGSLGVLRTIEGGATGIAPQEPAWPDTLQCGTTVPVPVTAVVASGDEGWLAPDAPFTFYFSRETRHPASERVAYRADYVTSGDAEPAGGTALYTDYATARQADVSLVAPPCSEVQTPRNVQVRISAAGAWSLSRTVRLVPPPPVRFEVVASRDTVSATDRVADVTTVAVDADGAEAELAWDTAVTLSAEPATGVFAPHRLPSGVSVTVPYNQGHARARARGSVPYVGPSEGPVCDTPVTVRVSGGGLSGSTEVVVRGTSAITEVDTLSVELSPSTLSSGEEATVRAFALSADGCDVGAGAISDSAMVTVVAFAGPFGLLEYDGVRSNVVRGATWGEVRAGKISFIASLTAPEELSCDQEDVAIVVSTAGLQGAASVRVNLGGAVGDKSLMSAQEARVNTAGAPCSEQRGITEDKASIDSWFRNQCSMPNATNEQVSRLYERSLALYFDEGMGWGVIPEYTRSLDRGLDGFTRWYVDTNGRRYPQVDGILEAKLTEGPPIQRSKDQEQAEGHIDFLDAQRGEWFIDFEASNPDLIIPPILLGQGGTLIYASQNQGAGDSGWRIGLNAGTRADGSLIPDYHNLILEHAAEREVGLIHAKVARVPLTGYRTLILRNLTPLRLAASSNPLVDWLFDRFTLDLSDYTYSTIFPLELRCDGVSSYSATR